MASDRGTKSILRKHFFASKIVLRVIVCCLRGVGSMSSSRPIPRFIVLFSSGHRWLFFVAWRMSSLRNFYVFVSSGMPFVDCATYLGRYLMYGDIHCTDFPCISYTEYFPISLSPSQLSNLSEISWQYFYDQIFCIKH